MEGFKVTTTLGQADWQALMRALAERANDRMGMWRFGRWISVGLWLFVVALAAIGSLMWPGLFDPLAAKARPAATDPPDRARMLWTDDYANVLSIVR